MPNLGLMLVQQAFCPLSHLLNLWVENSSATTPYTNPRDHVFTYHPKQAPSTPKWVSALSILLGGLFSPTSLSADGNLL